MRLSEHFTLSELTRSSLALRHGIDNTPGPEELDNLKRVVAEVLEPVRKYYGIPFSPSSGFRNPTVNRLAGSSDTSQHMKGEAADFEVPHVSNREVADWVKAHCKFDQLILEYHDPDIPNSGWVHTSVKESGNRGECLIFDGKSYRDF